jgi:hypothetical protein
MNEEASLKALKSIVVKIILANDGAAARRACAMAAW